jgi:hypothetical protein
MAEDKRGNGTAAETSPNNDRGPHQVAAEVSEIVRAALTESSLFRMTAQGLYWDPGEEKAPTWLSPYFDVLAHTRDVYGGQWGLLLSWRDLDHRVHEWAMPLAALGGGREEIWRALLAGGLRITPTPAGREKLAQYLSTVKVQGRALAVARIGWHLRSAAAAFVLPDRTYGESAYERIRWQSENRSETPYRCAGGLDDWRHHIGGRCKGNSRLVFGLSAGFAAPRALPLRCSKSPDRKAADCISLAAADREKPPSCTWPEAFGAVGAVFRDISARGVLPLIVLRPSPKRTATLCCALTSLGK